MQVVKLLTGFLGLVAPVAVAAAATQITPAIPLVFEQGANRAEYLARSPGGAVRLRSDGASVVTAGGNTVRIRLDGMRAVEPVPEAILPGTTNYFLGSDPARWRTKVRQFGRVRYRQVQDGVDLVFYGSGGELEYDLVLAPGSTSRNPELIFEGARSVSVDKSGDLAIEVGDERIHQRRPHVYQKHGDGRVRIDSRYVVSGPNRVRFALGAFDPQAELIIDPVIVYSGYVGKAGQESATGIAVDAGGNTIIVGETTSPDLSQGSVFQSFKSNDQDAFVAKLSPAGTLVFLTYIGGNRPDTGLGVTVDGSGNVAVTGVTYSADFPVKNAFQPASGGGASDGFVAKLNGDGTQLQWASYLGGSLFDYPTGIAADASNTIWVSGWTTSADFPTRNGFQTGPSGGGGDVFLTRVNAQGSTILYSTFFGGEGQDLASSLAIDRSGRVYVAGATTSTFFPFRAAAQTKAGGKFDGFVFCLDPAKNDLVFATLLGGSGDDYARKVAVDSAGFAYVLGDTDSVDFPVTAGVVQPRLAGVVDMFIAKTGPGALVYSTFVGGTGEDWAGGIAVDSAGSAYAAGWTNSANFPLRAAFQNGYAGGSVSTQRYDGTVLRLSPAGDAFLYSSYLGGTGEDKVYGIALDAGGSVYLAGSTTSADLPSASNTLASTQAGIYDGFVAKLSADATVNLVAALPSSLSFSAATAQTSIPPAAIALAGTGGTLAFSVASTVPWLQVTPLNGVTPGNLTVTVDPAQLRAGVNNAEIVVQSAANTLRIPVVVNVTVTPVVSATDPAGLVTGGGEANVVVTGSGFTAGSFVEVNGGRVPTAFVDASHLRVVLPGTLLAAEGSLRIVAVTGDTRSAAYPLPVSPFGPVFSSALVFNGASNSTGPIAPGEIVVIAGTGFGPEQLTHASPMLPGYFDTSLAGLRVLFDGVAAPVLWAMNGRVAVVAPYALAGPSTTVAVEFAGQQSSGVSIPVVAANPGLFTLDSTGGGQALAVHADGGLNGSARPAARGSVLVFYGTGEGTVDRRISDGALVPSGALTRPVLPVSVTVGGVPAVVEYAGGSPGQVSGFFQLNVRIPTGAPTGDTVPVVVKVGDFAASQTTTIAIQ